MTWGVHPTLLEKFASAIRASSGLNVDNFETGLYQTSAAVGLNESFITYDFHCPCGRVIREGLSLSQEALKGENFERLVDRQVYALQRHIAAEGMML